ncbi:MAG: hypothetical protein RL346_916 [Verrucomicrobiota bacterium]|jgi:mitochondrial fission protein ELM1
MVRREAIRVPAPFGFCKTCPDLPYSEQLSTPLHILIVSDGKAGHENQSLGLAEAMARRVPAEIHLLRVDAEQNGWARLRDGVSRSHGFPKPDYVISAGSRTHLLLWWLARKYDARSVVLMKPFWPAGWFDFCIAPEHDFPMSATPKNIMLSKGALNRVVPTAGKRSGRFVLIGGPSKIHGFDQAELISQILEVVRDGAWGIADSRRTPSGFLTDLKKQLPQAQVFSHQETPKDWLAGLLSVAEEVWVTEDSVSMIYEALTGGAKVGVLDMPRRRSDARVIRGLEKLKSDGFLIGHGEVTHQALAEADRCAGVILGS